MIPEKNQYDEEVETFTTALKYESTRSRLSTKPYRVGTAARPLSKGVRGIARRTRQYYIEKQAEFDAQHGPVRVIYSREKK